MKDNVVGLLMSLITRTLCSTYSLFGRCDCSEVNDCIDALEKRILLGELGNDLSVVGQIGPDELSSHVGL